MNALSRAFGASLLVSAVLFPPAWGAPRSVQIDVHAQTGLREISPYLFGRNVDVIDEKTDTLSAAETAWMNQVVEAGLHMIRANHGNNATRYNFRQDSPSTRTGSTTSTSGTGTSPRARSSGTCRASTRCTPSS